jgi:hypothetical protein
MVVKGEHLADAQVFHDHLGGAVRKRPLFVLIEPLKRSPGRLFKRFADMDDDQDTSRLHQGNGTFERHRAGVADIVEQQSVALIQNKVRDVEAGTLLRELLLEAEGSGMVAVAAVFDRISGAGVDKNRFHRRLAVFPVQVPVVVHGGI